MCHEYWILKRIKKSIIHPEWEKLVGVCLNGISLDRKVVCRSFRWGVRFFASLSMDERGWCMRSLPVLGLWGQWRARAGEGCEGGRGMVEAIAGCCHWSSISVYLGLRTTTTTRGNQASNRNCLVGTFLPSILLHIFLSLLLRFLTLFPCLLFGVYFWKLVEFDVLRDFLFGYVGFCNPISHLTVQ